MPVFDRFEHKGSNVVLWKVEESENELKRLFKEYSNEDISYPNLLREKTRQQKMASRLVSAMVLTESGLDYDTIFKDEFGKPRIPDSPLHFSISHSGEFAVAVVSESKVGIDIEYISSKIQRIKHKFCNEQELDRADTDQELIRIWSAKEAMYKAYGRRTLLFAEEMSVQGDRGKAKKNGVAYQFDIYSKIYNDNVMLTLCNEINQVST